MVVLDAGPLGLATNPTASPTNHECNRWVLALLAQRNRVVLPEIADFEVRRELLRVQKTAGLRSLDLLKTALEIAPITTAAMLQAAQFGAEARRRGQPTATPDAIDGDVILAGQAVTLDTFGEPAVVATTYPGRLARYVAARDWRTIG